MLARQLLHDPLDRRFHPEQRAAFDAGEGLFLVQDDLAQRCIRQVEPRLERDRRFRADRRADAALQTGIFLKAQLGHVRVVHQRARRAERDAAQTQGAGVRVHQNRAVGGTLRQCNWRLRLWVQSLGSHSCDLPAVAHDQHGILRNLRFRSVIECIAHVVRIAHVQKRHLALPGNRLGQKQFAVERIPLGCRRGQYGDRGKADRQRRQHLGMTKARHRPQFQRNDVRRQSTSESRCQADHLGPVRCMNQQARGASTRA